MKYLNEKKLTQPATEKKLLGNRIVLIAPKDSAATTDIKSGFDLSGLVGDGKLAMGNVDSVPAGKYGKAALEKLGAWDGVSAKLAQAENVRAALKLVATGEAAFGIVYQTDAASDESVKIVGTFPEESHPRSSIRSASRRRRRMRKQRSSKNVCRPTRRNPCLRRKASPG